MEKRRILALVLVLVMSITVMPRVSMAGNFESGAKHFIASLADEAVESLTKPNKPRPERERKFRNLLHQYFAYKTIAAWVLGRYWRRTTSAEKKEYFNLFEDLLVQTYVDRFARYPGASLKVEKAVSSGGGDVVVSTLLNRANGQPSAKVDWRLRSHDGTYKIVDVMVEGLSMGQTQRSEFASVIRQNGGTVKGLLTELRKKVKELKTHS